MAERIYRYEVPVDGEWHDVVLTGSPLRVGCRDVDTVEFWAIAHGLGAITRRFRVVGTGEALPSGARYWGTAIAPGDELVWHLVEAGP